MAKVVSPNKAFSFGPVNCAQSAIAIALLVTSEARADGARATTEAQAAEKKEQVGVRNLGTSGLEDENDPAMRAVRNERRSSFVMGLSVGGALGSIAGFPNDPTKLGLNRYYTDTGIGAGYHGRIWVGVALRDFFSFGLSFGTIGLSPGDNVFLSAQVGLHTEIFPAYSLGGHYRDLGIALETGTAFGYVTLADDQNVNLVDAGLASNIGLGVFYEGIRLGKKFGLGPYVSYDYMFSPSMRGGALALGLRMALYPAHK